MKRSTNILYQLVCHLLKTESDEAFIDILLQLLIKRFRLELIVFYIFLNPTLVYYGTTEGVFS